MPRACAVPLTLALAAGPVPGQAVSSVSGAEAVRAEIAQHGTVAIIAELAPPAGGELTPTVVAAARQRLARTLAAEGVSEVRGLGELPFVALEVDARQLDALLGTGSIVAVAPRRAATID